MKYRIPLLIGAAVTVSLAILVPAVYAQGTASSGQPSIPSALVSYAAQHPGNGCVWGTLDPLTIETCPTLASNTSMAIQGHPLTVGATSSTNTTNSTSTSSPSSAEGGFFNTPS